MVRCLADGEFALQERDGPLSCSLKRLAGGSEPLGYENERGFAQSLKRQVVAEDAVASYAVGVQPVIFKHIEASIGQAHTDGHVGYRFLPVQNKGGDG